MSELRLERINGEMQRAISEILRSEVKDPRVGRMCTVVRVRVTPDFDMARVYVGLLCDGPEADEMMRGLKQASGFIARQAGKRVRLRRTPRLEFIKDDSAAYAVYMSKKIDEVVGPARKDGGDE